MVLRLSLKRVVPGSVPPWRALVLCVAPRRFRAAGRRFSLARLKPCCDAADFLQAPRQEKQARSRQAIGVAFEAHLRARSCCFLANFLWLVFSSVRLALERGLSAASLVAACCRSCLTSLCCGARRSFVCARFVELRCRVWKLALGSGSWVGGIEIETFDELSFKKIYVVKSLNPKP